MSACVEDSVWSVVNKMTASVWMKILQTTGDGGSPKRMFGRIYGKQMMFKEFLLYQVFRRCQSERMLWDGLSEMQICPKTNNMTLSFPFLHCAEHLYFIFFTTYGHHRKTKFVMQQNVLQANVEGQKLRTDWRGKASGWIREWADE